VTHPYGPLGGDLHNNVVFAVIEYFARRGCTTLRLNFRGVGDSEGRTSWKAEAEMEDLRAAYAFLLESTDAEKVLLVGYSFGSVVACSVAPDLETSGKLLGLVAIGYPYSVLWFLTAFNSSKHLGRLSSLQTAPKLFVIGTHDNFTSVSSLKTMTQQHVTGPATLKTLEADHFFFGDEDELILIMDSWLKQHFPSLFLTLTGASGTAQ
ncbi:Alpha/Beta hydrolase protein, partial [Hyaloraphidium curvatum]